MALLINPRRFLSITGQPPWENACGADGVRDVAAGPGGDDAQITRFWWANSFWMTLLAPGSVRWLPSK